MTTEAEFQEQVISLAARLHWQYVHIRAAQTGGRWGVPVQGTLGVGWPDLVLVRGRRLIFAELKAGKGKLSADQMTVLDYLRETPAEVHVWRPEDLDQIALTLR